MKRKRKEQNLLGFEFQLHLFFVLWSLANRIPSLSLSFLVFELPWWLKLERTCLECGRPWFSSWIEKIPGLGRCPGEGNGYPLQYSCLGNPMDRSLAGYSPWSRKRVGHNLVTKQHVYSTVILILLILLLFCQFRNSWIKYHLSTWQIIIQPLKCLQLQMLIINKNKH